jgi:hypothetical protein
VRSDGLPCRSQIHFPSRLDHLNSPEPELPARRDALADAEIPRIAAEKRRNRRQIRLLRREYVLLLRQEAELEEELRTGGARCSIAVFELGDLEGQLALERHGKSQRKMAMEQLEVASVMGKVPQPTMQNIRTDRAGFRGKKLGLGRLRRRTSCLT